MTPDVYNKQKTAPGFKMNDCLCLKLFIYFVIMLKTLYKKVLFF